MQESTIAKIRTRATFVALSDKLNLRPLEADLLETALAGFYLEGQIAGVKEGAESLDKAMAAVTEAVTEAISSGAFVALSDKLNLRPFEADLLETALAVSYLEGQIAGVKEGAESLDKAMAAVTEAVTEAISSDA